MDLLKALDDLDRPALLKLRRRIAERLYEIREDEYAATVAAHGFTAPPGWGTNNDGQTDGETTVKKFLIEIGNTEVRPGHRKSCAQLRATLTVSGQNKASALNRLRKAIKKGEKDLWPVKQRASTWRFTAPGDVDGGGVEVELVFNVDTLTERDLKEVKA